MEFRILSVGRGKEMRCSMPLEIRRKHDGSLKSKYWYGAYSLGTNIRVDGRRLVCRICQTTCVATTH